ncbi:casein kinase [Blastomyces dermatitidis ATCC 18188]|uniref:Casein kinase n=1 Tax=Ajellomyces dermatitidis (strain ATCC 18188 / CBS 674.68) TaxID=653446 RepID=F2TLD7_AJEDA|nr:casein kinase [Blastomyces dermatitidis ATCC 18188]
MAFVKMSPCYVGNYRVSSRVPGTGSAFMGEAAVVKFGRGVHGSRKVAAEGYILGRLAGTPGIPRLHWSGWPFADKVDAAIVVDTHGPTLESLFDQAGRRLSLGTVLHLADQLLRRLEHIHSRSVIHQDLSPHTLALGATRLHRHQMFIVDFDCAEVTSCRSKMHANLKALGHILIYLLGTNLSWAAFQKVAEDTGTFPINNIPSPFLLYLDRITRVDSEDYQHLRNDFGYFRELLGISGNCCLDFSNSVQDPRAGRTLCTAGKIENNRSDIEHLYDMLHRAGGSVKGTGLPLSAAQEAGLLDSLSRTLGLYMDILIYEKTASTTPAALTRPYELPNCIWRDMRWYLAMAGSRSKTVRKGVMELCYSFVAVLVETVPRYELQWLAGLIALSNRRKGMEDDDWEQRIWQSVGLRWQKQYSRLWRECFPNSTALSTEPELPLL